MYTGFFGLKHEPFSIAPDPRYLYLSERHREALAHLLYGLRAGGGFVVLTGEIGAGKTTICRCCLQQAPRRTHVAYVFNPRLSGIELLAVVCEEFGIPVTARHGSDPSHKDHLDALNAYLLRTHAVGQSNVLIIDEAQALAPDVLEQLRLLTNLETDDRKLLQIVLIGQPELREMLARPQLEQLAQRVIARYHLGALTEAETAHYIRHRLAVSGLTGTLPFDREARRAVHRITGGVPRRINVLCDRALLGAYAQGRRRIDRAGVERAARELAGQGDDTPSRFGRWMRPASAAVPMATRWRAGRVAGVAPRFGWWLAAAAAGVLLTVVGTMGAEGLGHWSGRVGIGSQAANGTGEPAARAPAPAPAVR